MRLFSMGVPVIASLNGAFTALAHWWTLDLWFLANWASSSTSPDQRPAEYASVSRRKRAYDVTTISAPSTSVARSVLLRRRVSVMTARSEEHTSELQSLMRISYSVFCLKKKIKH